MQLAFYKYQGTGNDFILIDNQAGLFTYNKELVARLCDRNFGIGADGLILIENAEGFDFRMVYYNSDGSPATMCGNGGRCITAFANRLGVIDKNAVFISADGTHSAAIKTVEGQTAEVELTMKDVTFLQKNEHFVILNTGTPHYVSFVDDPDLINIVAEGRKIRYSPEFAPVGINVNFAKLYGNQIYVRTYEKGVEDETLSCGTGVTASAIAASLKYGGNSFYVNTAGGRLFVSFVRTADTFKNVKLTGPAKLVFEGTIEI